MSGRSSWRGTLVSSSTLRTLSAGTRGHWLTAERVTPKASDRRVTPPAALTARSLGVSGLVPGAYSVMVSIANP